MTSELGRYIEFMQLQFYEGKCPKHPMYKIGHTAVCSDRACNKCVYYPPAKLGILSKLGDLNHDTEICNNESS